MRILHFPFGLVKGLAEKLSMAWYSANDKCNGSYCVIRY